MSNDLLAPQDAQTQGVQPLEQIAKDLKEGQALQRTQSAYSTAVTVQKPRDIDKVMKNILREAEYARESFYYAWGEGDDHIEGPSVSLALAVVRNWGNCAVDCRIVAQTKDAVEFEAVFVDLETGFNLRRPFSQSRKFKVYGRMDDARKGDVRYQIGASKAIRNVVNNAMPKWMLTEAITAAKKAVYDGITREGIAKSTELALGALARYGVNEERVLAKLGKARNEIVAADIEDLRTAWAAIDNGDETAETIFPPIAPLEKAPAAGEPPTAPAAAKKTRRGKKAKAEAPAPPPEPEATPEPEPEATEPVEAAPFDAEPPAAPELALEPVPQEQPPEETPPLPPAPEPEPEAETEPEPPEPPEPDPRTLQIAAVAAAREALEAQEIDVEEAVQYLQLLKWIPPDAGLADVTLERLEKIATMAGQMSASMAKAKADGTFKPKASKAKSKS